jgi:DNA polymerase-3 subunit epsilon
MVFVDLETTGGMAASDRITEVGIVELDAQGRMTEWSSLVDPQMSIPSFIQGLTGITNEMVAGAPTFEQLAQEVLERLKGRLFVAHNARFDYGFLRHAFLRAGHDFHATVLCTVKLSRRLHPQFKKHGLDALIERHGLRAPARHRALADAQMVAKFWEVLQGQFAPDTLREAVDELTGASVWPAQLDVAILSALPEQSGVYVLYGEQDAPLFVAKGSNVRQRLLAHLHAERKLPAGRRYAHLVRRVEAHTTSGDQGAALLEARLINHLQPSHNRTGKDHGLEGACTWRWLPVPLADAGAVDAGTSEVDASEADASHADAMPRAMSLQLRPVDDFAGSADDEAYGLFGTRREALKTLKELTGEAQLCLITLGVEARRSTKACVAHASQQCSGVCVGQEALALHTERFRRVMAAWRLPHWPHEGAVAVEEGGVWHVLDAWRHLGSVPRLDEAAALMANTPRPAFDRRTFKILSAWLAQADVHPVGPAGPARAGALIQA